MADQKSIEDMTFKEASIAGELIGRGVVGYSSDDMLRVRGLKLEVIARFLGEAAAVPAVHRDELLVL